MGVLVRTRQAEVIVRHALARLRPDGAAGEQGEQQQQSGA